MNPYRPPSTKTVRQNPHSLLTVLDVTRSPELAALALLDEALAVSRIVLLAQHPELDDELHHDEELATTTALAETLVARASDLRRLLATYRRAIEEHRRHPVFFDSDSDSAF